METFAEKMAFNTTELFGPETWKTDERITSLPLMSSPWPVMSIFMLYGLMVTYGPKYMEKRKAFELQGVIMVYNVFMVFVSASLFIELGLSGWFGRYSFRCQPVETSPEGDRMVRAIWLFYLSKLVELLDTVFFIMRKKNNQVSFLHLFHHSVIPITWWFFIRYFPGGCGTFHGWVNTVVHTVMYTYYGIAALGPAYRKYLWWKKYITIMQLIQFVVCGAHMAQLLFIEDCCFPKILIYTLVLYAVILFSLFGNFYIHNYVKKTVPRGEKQASVKIKNKIV